MNTLFSLSEGVTKHLGAHGTVTGCAASSTMGIARGKWSHRGKLSAEMRSFPPPPTPSPWDRRSTEPSHWKMALTVTKLSGTCCCSQCTPDRTHCDHSLTSPWRVTPHRTLANASDHGLNERTSEGPPQQKGGGQGLRGLGNRDSFSFDETSGDGRWCWLHNCVNACSDPGTVHLEMVTTTNCVLRIIYHNFEK